MDHEFHWVSDLLTESTYPLNIVCKLNKKCLGYVWLSIFQMKVDNKIQSFENIDKFIEFFKKKCTSSIKRL